MSKFNVVVCYEKWEYYDIEVDAEHGTAAEHIARRMWRENPGQFHRRKELDTDNGISVTDCHDVEEDQLS